MMIVRSSPRSGCRARIEAHALTEAVAAWVHARSGLKALGLTGSWPRGSARSDSDLDVGILADDPEQYQSDLGWLSQIALRKSRWDVDGEKQSVPELLPTGSFRATRTFRPASSTVAL